MYRLLGILFSALLLCSFTPAKPPPKSPPRPTQPNQGVLAQLPQWPQNLSDAMNQQITMEMQASIEYLNLGAHFAQLNTALPNIANYFMEQSTEETEHANMLINYQLSRGGELRHGPLQPPSSMDSITALSAFQKALDLEVAVYRSLLNLWKIGDQSGFPEFCDWLSSTLITHQVESMAELARIITNINTAESDLPLYEIDTTLSTLLKSDD